MSIKTGRKSPFFVFLGSIIQTHHSLFKPTIQSQRTEPMKPEPLSQSPVNWIDSDSVQVVSHRLPWSMAAPGQRLHTAAPGQPVPEPFRAKEPNP